MEALTAFFIMLFLIQTVIFLYFYRRAVTQRDVTQPMENHITSPQDKPSGHSDIDMLNLHGSALAALRLIMERGSVISSDVSKSLNLSREHAARIMKNLYMKGLVTRSGKPFRYTLTDKGFALLDSKKSH